MNIKDIINRFCGTERKEQEELSAREVLPQMLKKLQVEWKSEEIEGGQCHDFKYQGGFFRIITCDTNNLILIIFPFLVTTGIENLQPIRVICNRHNNIAQYTSVVYSQEESNPDTLALHLEASMRLSNYTSALFNDFEWLLQVIFHDCNKLSMEVNELSANNSVDKEEANIYRQAEIAMMQEYERETVNFIQTDGGMLCPNDGESHCIDNLLTRTFQTSDISYRQLTITTERLDSIEDEKSIRNFDITDLLTKVDFTRPDDDTPLPRRFVRSEATAIIRVCVNKGDAQSIVLHLSAENEDDDALSMRLTMAIPEKSLSESNSFTSRNHRERPHYSFIITLPTKDSGNLREECKYRLQEAQDARKQHKTLTREQALLLRCKDSDVEYNVFCGYRLYLQKHYFDAIQHLENAYYAICTKEEKLPGSKKKLYYDVCFYLGCCYMSIGMCERAQYYIDNIRNIQQFSYVMLCIKNMQHLHHPDLLDYVRRMYVELHELQQYSSEDSQPDSLIRYRHFLMLVLVRLLAEAGDFTEAQSLAKALHNEGCDSEQLESFMEYLEKRTRDNPKDAEGRQKWAEILKTFEDNSDEDKDASIEI